MARRALIVGINTYGVGNHLNACVADAKAMAEVLARHKDGEKNFDCLVWLDKTEDGSVITRPKLRAALTELFKFDGDDPLYFSGHGFLSKTGGLLLHHRRNEGRLGYPDARGGGSRDPVDGKSHPAHPRLLPQRRHRQPGHDEQGRREEPAGDAPGEHDGHRRIARDRRGHRSRRPRSIHRSLLDALEGGAADHMGFVTDSALYAYVSRRFAALDQRPVYKTSATDVLIVRECEPLIGRLLLRQLATHFPKADHQYRLDPEYEPEDEHGNVKEPVNHEKVAIAQLFKSYRDAGLLKPSDPKL